MGAHNWHGYHEEGEEEKEGEEKEGGGADKKLRNHFVH